MLLARTRNSVRDDYIPAIDGLRAVAVLSVIIFHLDPSSLPGGFIGVDVFFVISGFVVTKAMSRRRDVPFFKFIGEFYARRFRRIVPPLLGCLCLTVPLAFAVIPDAYLSQAIPKTALSAFYGASNFALIETTDGYFSVPASLNPFMHTWSLAVEEQFYIVFPLLFYVAMQNRESVFRRFTRYLIIVISLASFLFCAWSTAALPTVAYYSLPSRFWELMLGSGISMLEERRHRKFVDTIGQPIVMNLGIGLIAATAVAANEKMFPFPWALPGCLGTSCVIMASRVPTERWSCGKVLEGRLLISIGMFSYSLYLWHWPIFTIMRWTIGLNTPLLYVAALLMVTVFSWTSYLVLELTAQNSKLLNRAHPIAVIACISIITFLGYLICDHPWGYKLTIVEKNRNDWYPSATGEKAEGNICAAAEQFGMDGFNQIRPTKCSIKPPRNPHIYVIGDSHAGAYQRIMRTLTAKTGLSVTIASGIACNEADFLAPSSQKVIRCASSIPYSNTIMNNLRPGDIVFLASLRSVRLSGPAGIVDQKQLNYLTQSDHAIKNREAASREADALLARFEKKKAIVILDLPMPVFKAPAYRCSDWFNRSNPVCQYGLTVSRDELEQLRAPVVSAMIKVAARHSNTYIWDPFQRLCPTNPCSALRGDRPLFFDGDHLSGYGNDLLTPYFIQLINRIRADHPN